MAGLMKLLQVCLFLYSVIEIQAYVEQQLLLFHRFKIDFNKSYANQTEEHQRFDTFLRNVELIEKHNFEYTQGLHTYVMDVNEYTDWTAEEFQQLVDGSDERDSMNVLSQGALYIPPANVELPVAVDWRELGAVTPVRRQKKCGACWAFAATGALEGQHFRASGELVQLSVQNLLDCTSQYGNKGCSGGMKENAFAYVRDNGGIDTESSYPYQAKETGQCLFNPETVGAKSKGFMRIASKDELALMAAVATIGPVATVLNRGCLALQFYKEGVFSEQPEACEPKPLNHAMLLVGYGRHNVTQMDYWIVKNSWGPKWGIDGYVMLPRYVNYAGIAMRASFPLM